MKATYWRHSGFSVEAQSMTLLFDYIGGGFSRVGKPVCALVSHSHADHRMKDIEESCDFLVEGMKEGERRCVENACVRAFGSTDEGVSFLVSIEGKNIFHAGDLNLWHWPNESTEEEIALARRDYMRIIKTIEGERIDIAFFPLDSRMGEGFDEGARIFLRRIRPAIMVPMHWWKDIASAISFAEQFENVRALSPGESIEF